MTITPSSSPPQSWPPWPERLFRPLLLILLGLAALWPGPLWAQAAPNPARDLLRDRQHLVYFRNTAKELHVYKIYGRRKGPTIMIMGGIQGDEPGGFLSADLYADLALKKGNLIVVPRANFESILRSARGPFGDMNRKFGLDLSEDPDAEIIPILTALMEESDLLLNLHDGSGFYRPTWESELANPNRYGQSIIADTDVYTPKGARQSLNLKEMAEKVIAEINGEIDEPRYKFHFMNTNTGRPDSRHHEQRHSATYYALTKVGIPAFGVETSKQLPTLEMKVHQHNLAVNAFMRLLGVEAEHPRIYLDPPKLEYLIISVNGRLPVAVPDQHTLLISPGDAIEVVHVGANYDRGLSVDIVGEGALNDIRRRVIVANPTTIVAQKDNVRFGRIKVDLARDPAARTPMVEPKAAQVKAPAGQDREPGPTTASAKKAAAPPGPDEPPPSGPFRVTGFIIEVDGQTLFLKPGETAAVPAGAKIKLIDFKYEGRLPAKRLVLNFKGFTPPGPYNGGEDRGYVIDTATDLIPRFSVSKTEPIYEVAVEEGVKILAKVRLRLLRPQLEAVELLIDGRKTVLKPGRRLTVPAGAKVTLLKAGLAAGQKLTAPSYTLGGRVMEPHKPMPMPEIAVSLAVFEKGVLAGKVVLTPGKSG